MAIPSIQAIMLPLLDALADGRERAPRELVEPLSNRFGLTEEERQKTMPNGREVVLLYRIKWSRTALKKAGLVEDPARGRVRITDLGRSVLAEKPQTINDRFLLSRFPPYREWMRRSKPNDIEASAENSPAIDESQSPLELIDAAHQSLSAATAEEVLERLKACSPAFFERVVVDLLLAMGYGGGGRRGDGDGEVGRWRDRRSDPAG